MSSHPPDWVKNAVFYQIFPDRFAWSDKLSKPSNLEPWLSAPTYHGYKGGDLVGVVEKLDYLQELGITAIYLNPIFQSASNHRYHTHDYYQVDPLLGGNKALENLVDSAHARNIRVVLDGVFNHASRGFFQFSDVLENGASSPWVNWFHIKDWPISAYDQTKPTNYECWFNLPALPKLNTDNPAVRNFIMEVAEYWIREYDIDGWRLDVPNEIRTEGFWEEFRYRVKKAKSDAYIVGEIWKEAEEWVNGRRFDAVMNYPFTEAVIAFTAGDRVSRILTEGRDYQPYPKLSGGALSDRLTHLLDIYGLDFSKVQMNLLDSHDTPRLISLTRGDKDSLKLATLIQMTFVGAPCVYYGDEIAIRGTNDPVSPHRDPDARWAFPWQEESAWDYDMLTYFKELINIRQQHEALRSGRFISLLAQKDCLTYCRSSESENLIVIVNSGSKSCRLRISKERLQKCIGSLGNPANVKTIFGDPAIEFNQELVLNLSARQAAIVKY